MTLVEVAMPFLMWFGGGSIIGYVVGYAVKKIAKIAAFVIGLFFFGVMYLSYVGIAKIDWQKAEHVTRAAAMNATTQVINVVNSTAQQYAHHAGSITALPMVGASGFVISFVMGLKKG